MSTKIDADYLKNAFGYDIKREIRGEAASSSTTLAGLFNGVYDEMYILAVSQDVTVETVSDMELRLDTPEKKEWFKKAQAYQLMYEMSNGRNPMFVPESFDTNAKAWDWCSQTLRIMRFELGFNRPTLFTQR